MTVEHPQAEDHPAVDDPQAHYASFEVGENQVPWFLWVFFVLIILWAMVSWIPLFGY